MKKLQFFDVNEDFIKKICKIDSEIRISKSRLRPYLFTKININNKPYLLPLSSPKSSKTRAKDIVDAIYDKDEIIGYIEYYKMIPYHEKIATPIDFSNIQDQKYKQLLMKDYRYITNKLGIDHVQRKATLIYKARYNHNHYLYKRYLKQMGTDILKIEKFLVKYIKELGIEHNIEFEIKEL